MSEHRLEGQRSGAALPQDVPAEKIEKQLNNILVMLSLITWRLYINTFLRSSGAMEQENNYIMYS